MAKSTKKLDESQPQKLARWLETGISISFGLGVIILLSLFAYVVFTQVIKPN